MTKHRLRIGLQFFVVFLLWNHFKESARAQESIAIPSAKSDTPSSLVTNSIGMKLVPITAGRFTMGSPASERGSQEDEVLHKVELTRSFHMGATEVTEHQWAMVMEEPFRTEIVEVRDPDTKRLIKKDERQFKNPKLDSQLPITDISWLQAVEFCKRLNQLPEEKKEGRHYRLPTEAEWEYACRAETSTAFNFGEDKSLLNDYAWHQENSSKLMPVALKKTNAWGLYDMHGNAAEWCQDYYGNYGETLTIDPVGPETPINFTHTVRGGTFQSNIIEIRSGSRGKLYRKNSLTGFRVILGSELKRRDLEVMNKLGMEMVLIDAGEFRMGNGYSIEFLLKVFPRDDLQHFEYSSNSHLVKITRPFYMGVHEVTVAQFRRFIQATGYKTDAESDGKGGSGIEYDTNTRTLEHRLSPKYNWERLKFEQTENHPVVNVSWNDAVAFCKWLSQQEGENYRLPTEAEWEYACRAGTRNLYWNLMVPEGLTKIDNVRDRTAMQARHWADFVDSSDGFAYTAPVCSFVPNPWGLYDVHGNVCEWCSDAYSDYSDETVSDPTGPSIGRGARIYRGGSWYNTGVGCTYVSRSADEPNYRRDYLGFRVVLSR